MILDKIIAKLFFENIGLFSHLLEHEVQYLLFEPFGEKVFYYQPDDTIYYIEWYRDKEIQLTFNFEKGI